MLAGVPSGGLAVLLIAGFEFVKETCSRESVGAKTQVPVSTTT